MWKLLPWAVRGRLGYAFALSGRLPEGRDLLEEVERSATTMSSMGVGRAMQLTWLGEAYLLEGRLDDALRRAHEALTLAERQQERSNEAWSFRLLGEIASHRDPRDVEGAETYYREALAFAAHCHFHSWEAVTIGAFPEQARQHLTTATTMYREMGMRVWLDQVDAEMRKST